MTTKHRLLLCASAVFAFSSRASALEISLEENRAQRGNIGYVDMQKIFRLNPETGRAKQSFSEIVHQAEEQVSLKKAELMSIRTELSKLNMEHDLLQKTPIPAAVESSSPVVQAPAVQAPAISSAAAAPPAQAPAVSAATAPVVALPSPFSASSAAAHSDFDRLPGMSKPLAEEPQKAPPAPPKEPLVINIPGMNNSPVVVQPPAEAAAQAPAPAVSSAAAAAVAPPDPAALARRNARLKELEDAIAAKIGELGRKEAEFKEYQGQVEKNLTDVESRRSEALLAKIYTAVREVARENGVSVIVDKTQIVFGTGAVDLTDKVIKKLEGPQ